MRITFVSPLVNMGGGTRVIALQAQGLARRGHQVTVVSSGPPRRSLRRWCRDLLQGRWRSSPSSSHFDSVDVPHVRLPDDRPMVDADLPDADVVIATWWETAEWVARLSASKGKKAYFVQGHEVFPFLPQDRCRATYHLPLAKIVVSKWLADIMASAYGDHGAQVVLNGVDHQQFFAPERGRQARPTVGFIFSTSDVKGGDLALDVVRRLRQRQPGLRLLSFSTQSFPAAASLGIEFHHSPPQDRLRALYAQCDVWLSTSRSEGFNLPAMEAMACRTPVVSTRTGWPVHGIVEGVNGRLADVDDVAGLVEAVEKVLMQNDAQWRAMSAAAFRTVTDATWERSTEAFEHALQRIVAGAGESGSLGAAAARMPNGRAG